MKYLKTFITYLLLIPVLVLTIVLSGCQDLAPNAPSNVQSTDGVYADRVAITWNAPSTSGGGLLPLPTAEYYKVFRSNKDWIILGMFFQVSLKVNTTSYVDSTVNPDDPYYYKVKAFSANDTASEFSEMDPGFAEQDLGPVKPVPPAGISVDCDVNTITWGTVPNADSYGVHVASTSGGSYTLISSGITGTSLTDSQIVEGNFFVVTATNSAGTSDFSSEDDCEIDPLCDGPSANVDEFFDVVYTPVMTYSKSEKMLPANADPFPGDKMLFWGDASGKGDIIVDNPSDAQIAEDNTCYWEIFFNADFSVTNQFTFKNYNDGDRGIATNAGGLTLNGTWGALLTIAGDGMNTGVLTITGSHEASADYHIVVLGKDSAPDPDPETGSWTTITYCGETTRYYYSE